MEENNGRTNNILFKNLVKKSTEDEDKSELLKFDMKSITTRNHFKSGKAVVKETFENAGFEWRRPKS